MIIGNEGPSKLDTPGVRVILYEGAGTRLIGKQRRRDILSTFLKAGFPVSRVTPNSGGISPADDSPLVILGDFEDSSVPEAQVAGAQARTSLRLITDPDTAEDLLSHVEAFRDETNARKPDEWMPWFPVIDYDRCTNCMQCLSFCLFGVYDVDGEHRITVQNQDKCKTNCPACSRVCPEVAIMFPKYHAGPANGDEVRDEDIHRESMKIDISALLGGDIYQKLRERREAAKERFARERDEEKALMERKRCLKKLTQEMDIPPEVLSSLPSPAEIKQRAEEAARKASEASMARRKKDFEGDYGGV
jgi:Pyruvate/2-oxoacid:ferredoxin oxidoreductase delta subunit